MEVTVYLPGPFSVSYEKGKFEGKGNTQNSKADREREREKQRNPVLKTLFVFLALGMQRFIPDLIRVSPCL